MLIHAIMLPGPTARDRVGRIDDSLGMISEKLASYRARTAPRIDYYTNRGCRIFPIQSTECSTPETACAAFIAAGRGRSRRAHLVSLAP